jgi:GGDEF domain-containing protein
MELTRDAHDLPLSSPWSLRPRMGVALLLLLLPALLMLEWTGGRAFSLYLFYLCPVALAAWNFGYRVGFAIAVLSAAYCIFVALTLAGPSTPMEPLAMQGASVLAMFMLFAYVIAHHREFVDNAVSAARTDLETGALSRREFHRVLHSEAWRANRYHRPLAVVLMEADGSSTARMDKKAFYGKLGEALRTNVRECDAVARLGDRRFAMLLVECPQAEAALVLERTRTALARVFGTAANFNFGVTGRSGTVVSSASVLLRAAAADMESARLSPKLPGALNPSPSH